MPFTPVYRERGPTTAALNAQLERDWVRHQAEAKAQAEAEQLEQDRRLEVEGTTLFLGLGEAVRDVVSQDGWVSLAERIDAMVEGGELSSRHGRELLARLRALAVANGWLSE